MAEEKKAPEAEDGWEGKKVVSEEDRTKAEAMKNKANEFFKCERLLHIPIA